MSKGDNSPGLSRLAGMFRRMANDQIPNDLILDFGVIQEDKSLLTNTAGVSIPKSDYLVCRHLKSRNVNTGSADGHRHSVETREVLEVGDRVLVGWINEDAVVIDIILDADDVL